MKLSKKVTLLENKEEIDRMTILRQCQYIEKHVSSQKKANLQIKKLSTELHQVNKLFRITLRVKLHYEQVITSLIENPETAAFTRKVIDETPEKRVKSLKKRETMFTLTQTPRGSITSKK